MTVLEDELANGEVVFLPLGLAFSRFEPSRRRAPAQTYRPVHGGYPGRVPPLVQPQAVQLTTGGYPELHPDHGDPR